VSAALTPYSGHVAEYCANETEEKALAYPTIAVLHEEITSAASVGDSAASSSCSVRKWKKAKTGLGFISWQCNYVVCDRRADCVLYTAVVAIRLSE